MPFCTGDFQIFVYNIINSLNHVLFDQIQNYVEEICLSTFEEIFTLIRNFRVIYFKYFKYCCVMKSILFRGLKIKTI